MKDTIKYAVLHATGAVAYIALVATVMTKAEHLIKGFEGTMLPPVLFLTLFVLSAAVMGLTFFGRPVLWYLEGKKQDAVELTLYTVLAFALIFCALFALVLFFGGEVFGVRT